MDECDVLDLTVDAFDETKLCLGATIFLALVVRFLGDFGFEDLRRL